MHLEVVQEIDDLMLKRLAALLINVVSRGASLGFLASIDQNKAESYWREVDRALAQNTLLITVSEAEQILGAVQLILCTKDNGQHRAEIAKLMVHAEHQGRGISSQLMQAAEIAARAAERYLLILDTEVGSPAESIYQHWGWQKVGEVPNYAADPQGRLHGTAYYYKALC